MNIKQLPILSSTQCSHSLEVLMHFSTNVSITPDYWYIKTAKRCTNAIIKLEGEVLHRPYRPHRIIQTTYDHTDNVSNGRGERERFSVREGERCVKEGLSLYSLWHRKDPTLPLGETLRVPCEKVEFAEENCKKQTCWKVNRLAISSVFWPSLRIHKLILHYAQIDLMFYLKLRS